MPTPPMPLSLMQQAVDCLKRYGSESRAARELQIPRATLQSRLRKARQNGISPTPFLIDPPPDATLPAEAIIARRKQQFAHLQKAEKAKHLIPVRVAVDGPIGISHFGDPHLDDDGTDIARIERDVNIVKRTPGMMAANIGDGINAWVGRLARLYAEQSTSEAEAIRLYEWFLREVPWLYCLGGNHLAWHSGMGVALHRWIMSNCATLFDNSSVRLELRFPNGRAVRVNARHDFAGHSMWNTVHGPLKAATMGWRDHLLTCGHTHTSGYAILKDPATALISHAVRLSSYKTFDRYAHEKGLPNQDIFANAVTIIDPRYSDDDPRLIHMCFDPEQGADYLTWLRNRKN